MNLETIKARIPDYAKDLRLNLDSVLSESGAPGLSAEADRDHRAGERDRVAA